MDQQEQQRLNEAAQQFADAFVQSQRVAADRSISMQEQNAQLTQEFFNRVIENLSSQAEDTRQMGQELAGQQQRAAEAGQTLTQESVNAYMDFVNSMFSFGQQGAQAAQRGAQEAPPRGGGGEQAAQGDTRVAQSTATEAPPESQESAELPLEDYDSLTVEQISERLDDLSVEQIRQLRAYEAEDRNRSTLLRRLDERIEA